MEVNEFRKRLEKATEHGIPNRHPDCVAALKEFYPHNITVQGNPNWIENSECFLYVFRDKIDADLIGVFERLVEDNPDLYERIGESLISKGFISLHDDRRPDDQVVVYFQQNDIKHFGKLVEDQVVSKWGKGCIWKHDLFEVPFSYGSRVMYSTGQINETILKDVVDAFQRQLKK